MLDAAKLGGLTAGAVTAVLGAGFTIRVAVATGNPASVGTAVGVAVTAVVSLLAYLAPRRFAREARAQVTPLEDPRDDAGRQMVAITVPPSQRPSPRPR